jgi:hypothetical protein
MQQPVGGSRSGVLRRDLVDDGDGGTRAILLSDVGGKQLATVSCGDYEADDLRSVVKTAIGAIYGLGVSPSDANLV